MSKVLDAPAVPDTPPPLSIHIDMLGGFRLCIAAQPVEDRAWRLRKGRSLLKLLALEPSHRLPRDVVLDLLWPDLDPDAAANNLHQTVHAVRRVLGANRLRPVVLLDRTTVSIDPATSVSTDVQAFERAVEAARGGEDITQHEEAVALYAGDLLPDDLYEDWTASRREYLRERFLTVLLDLGALYTARGDTDRAIDTLQRLIAFDPIREDAHATLMRLYAAAGKRQTALRQYSLLREALWRELGVEPDRETEKLYAEILAGSFDRPAPPPPLPVPLTSFIGRAEECQGIAALLNQSRLVTLVGPGGCGKTRLALAALAGREAHFADLAPLSGEHAVTDALLAAFSLPNTGDPFDALASAIGTRQVLLLLDNCEHLIAATAEAVATLLRRCSGLRVLATSREPLNVPGETLFRVPPLSLPPEGSVELDVLRRSTAVQLFEERARARDAGFRLDAGNAEAVAGICCRLEGAPLAIELAASRIPTLPPAEIAARLDDALALLQTRERGAPERHRALRATLDWSYSLLSLAEQRVFAHIGVFAGGFGLAEAERLGEGLVDPREMLDLLAQMVERSLLIAGTSGEDARFRLSEPVRQYALDTLRRAGEYDSARGRHASVYLALAERARPELRGANQSRWMDRLASEHDNLRTALRWLIDRGEKERAGVLAGALWRFWQTRGHGAEGLRWLEAVRTMPGELEPSTHARVLSGLVGLLYRLGDLQHAAVLSDEALSFTRAHGTDNELAVALNNHGTLLLGLRRTNEAIGLLEESLALHRSLADNRGIALSLRNLGQALSITGKYQRALVCYEEVLALRRAQGDTWGTASALAAAALVLYELDQVRRAEELYRESYSLAEELGDRSLMAEALIGLALVQLDENDLSGSRKTLERAMSLLSDLREERTALWVRNLHGEVVRRQGDLAHAWKLHRPTLGTCLAQSYLPEMVEPLLAAVSIAQSLGEHEVGARLLGGIHGLIARLDVHPHRWERDTLGELEAALQQSLGAKRAGDLLNEGRELSADEAVGLALALPD